MPETVIVVPSGETDTPDVSHEHTETAEVAARDSVTGAEVAVSAAVVSQDAAENASESAEEAEAHAGVATAAAGEARMTLEGLADIINKLPERLAPLMGQGAVQESAASAPEPPSEPEVKEKPKPDVKPDKSHWYYGGKKK